MDFELFVPLQDDYVINGPRNSDVLIIQKYGAVPLGSDPSEVTKDLYFCFVGIYQVFINLNVATSRLLNVKVREDDYKMLSADRHARLFDVWNKHGKSDTIPAGLLVDDVALYPNFSAWDKEQYKRWSIVFDSITGARPKLAFNVISRFIQPAADQISLVFTPLPQSSLFDVKTLTSVFKTAFDDETLQLPQYKYKVTTWQEAVADGLILTGAHYLHLYFTWMTASDFTKVWATLQQTPELPRPWPSDSLADAINSKILNHQTGGDIFQVTIARMTHVKALSVLGKRKYDDQKTIMGASATDLAKAMWDAKTLKGVSPVDAEWVHRNVFHFGGLSDAVDLATFQARENLVFSTGECNTHMIRVENTISSLLAANAQISQDNHRSGTLITTNQFNGTVARFDLSAKGLRRHDTIPAWVEKEKYKWLSLGLLYEWRMGPTLTGLTFNAEEQFDPFSRYIPLRVEARLDDVLMDYLYEQTVAASAFTSSSSAAKLNVTMALDVTNVPTMVGNSSEATHIWNAAKANLPQVQANNVKIMHPAIKQQPAEEELPSESPIRIIGADPLFSPVPPGRPVKAVRVVDTTSHAMPIDQISQSLPVATGPISETHPPADGFAIVGDIELFGEAGLKAKFEKWYGPAPPDIVVRPGTPVLVERATLTGDFILSSAISELRDTPFDNIVFRNVAIFHQNYQFDATKAIGWHFNANLVIDNSVGTLRNVLTQVFGVDEPVLPVHLYIGTNGAWDKPPSLHSFTLEGIFSGLAAKPINGVVISRIGVRLFGVRTLKFDPSPRSVLEYRFSMFGTMNLDVPSSTIPLTMDYEAQESSGTLSLNASLSTWKNPLGANGFTLVNASFFTSFGVSSPWKSLVFGVSADFMFKDIRASFEGSYALGGSFEMNTSIYNVNVTAIDTLFEWITDGNLSIPNVDISIGTIRLSIASGKGLDISLDKVTIGDYTSVDAGLTITSHGVHIRGVLPSTSLQFGDIELKRAFLQVQFEAKSNGNNTDVIVGGEITFSDLVFDAAVHLYQSPDSSLEWTVLAALTVGDNSLALSKVAPEVKGTPFDLSLTHVVFVAASRDDPSLGNMITSGYSFHKGVQVCAVLSQIGAINSLMRRPVSGLTLSAGWSKANGFELDVSLPTSTSLNLGNGITTTPIKLAIQTMPRAQLLLSAGLNVPVAHSPKPLLFTLSLTADMVGASVTGQLSGWWVNPFGISPNVKVGPNLGLSISIIFAQFVTTGTPSGFAIQGGLMIGKTQAQLALSINEDPLKELLYTEIQSLNLTDVTAFASDIIGVAIPDPPGDFLEFEVVKLYICPAGVTIGATVYPQGFSFQADMILFGKRANIACQVESTQISIKGGVDNFALGPLTVRGTSGPRAVIECEIGPNKQHLLIDGLISLFVAETTVHVAIDVLPKPQFMFFTQLKFTELLLFKLDASLIGSLSFSDLSGADFMFDALFEQHILEYIHDQVMRLFDEARQAADAGIEAAQKKIVQAQAEWNADINKAQAGLDAAKEIWDKMNEQVTADSNRIIDDYNKQIYALNQRISDAQQAYNNAISDAQRAVDGADLDRAHALQNAEHDVDNARRDMTDSISNAQQSVDDAERALDAAFGSAQSAIESARSNVRGLQNQIDALNRKINEYRRANWRQAWKVAALPGLYASLSTLQASKAVADGFLRGAEATLTSSDYVSKQTAFRSAQAALEVAKWTGPAVVDAAQVALKAADVASQAAVDAANATLEATKVGVEWTAINGAQAALQGYQDANDAAFKAATQALIELPKSAELLAYNAAKTGLDAARSATVALDTAKVALETVRVAADEALAVGKWVAEHATGLFDIRAVHLSGTLRSMVGSGGKMTKPFAAHIEGVVMGQGFTLDGELDINKTSDFIAFIFKNLWPRIKAGAKL